ncbi:MAG: peptide/nickel transport system permease protein [Ilumatobacteraceae bacterium]|jgi:peptide/nickel transport system permease protein
MTDIIDDAIASEMESGRPPGVWRVALRMWRTRIGLLIVALLCALAMFGRYVAPYGEAEAVGLPFKPSGATRKDTLLGSANVGHDVLTRFLYGGRPILVAAVLATLLALVLGTTIGLIAAYNRGKLDDVLMRSMDVILALPQIISALIVISMFGATTTLIILTVGISTVPRIARVVRGAAVSVVERDFVAAAESLGESRLRILRSELLPNVSGPLLVEANLRLTFSIGLIAGIAFLGFTPDPGAANWGLMINENRKGLVPNHWGVTLPVIAIALLTIGTGLVGDGLSRAAAGIDRVKGDS